MESTQERIYKIIRGLSGKVTDKQRYMVWHWLLHTNYQTDTESVMKRIWRESAEPVPDEESVARSLKTTKDKINRKSSGSMQPGQRGRGNSKILPAKQKKRYWLAAACLIALVGSSLLFIARSPFDHSRNKAAFVGQALPSNDIQLISGANVMKINQNSHISLKKDGQVALINENKESEIILSKKEMNRLIVPYGKRSTLELSDGTKVWMNSGTELEFPSEFEGDTRDIFLKGEIYIEVASMHNKPFYVHLQDFTIHVTGTKFNVSAYTDALQRTVVLVEGNVEINSPGKAPEKLLPDQILMIGADGIRKEKTDVTKYTCWKDGILMFNKAPISDVLQKIGRYYNVSFDDFSDDFLSTKTCTGKLYLSDNLDEVLMSVAILSETEYYRDKNTIYIRNRIELN